MISGKKSTTINKSFVVKEERGVGNGQDVWVSGKEWHYGSSQNKN